MDGRSEDYTVQFDSSRFVVRRDGPAAVLPRGVIIKFTALPDAVAQLDDLIKVARALRQAD